MLNNILGKVTKPQHASVHNKVSRVKNPEGGGIYAPPPPGSDRVNQRQPSSHPRSTAKADVGHHPHRTFWHAKAETTGTISSLLASH